MKNCEFDIKWEGRVLLDWTASQEDVPKNKILKFLSYNVLADYRAESLRYTTTRSWEKRKYTQLFEIKDYNADIMCLQDVDNFHEWWQPQLMLLGYDSIWKQRTNECNRSFNEGVLIAFKRNLYHLFKTNEIHLNEAYTIDSNYHKMKQRLRTDDVGLILLLQPTSNNIIRTALCIGCCIFNDSESDTIIRDVQCKYFTRCIEVANRDFHLPVLLGLSLQDEPDSNSYHILRTGRITLAAQAPRPCSKPRAESFCRGSAAISWLPPKQTEIDPPILQYKIAWRPGGSKELNFLSHTIIDSGNCIQYISHKDAKGVRRTIALEDRKWIINKLNPEIPYEFRILAMNEVGEGEWSDISDPIILTNPDKAPPMPPLIHLQGLEGVRLLRESTSMAEQDWDVETTSGGDALSALTLLTPRTIRGSIDRHVSRTRVLPASTNPRHGWMEDFKGQTSQSLKAELNHVKRLAKSVLRTADGFHPHISDTPHSRVAVYDIIEHGDDDGRSKNTTGKKRISFQDNDNDGDDDDDDDNEGVEEDVMVYDSSNVQEAVSGQCDYITNTSISSIDYIADSGSSNNQCESSSVITVESKSSFTPISSIPSQSTSNPMPVPSHELNKEDYNDNDDDDSELEWSADESADGTLELSVRSEHDGSSVLHHKLDSQEDEGHHARQWDDDVYMDCHDVMRRIGTPHPRQVHSLGLRSVYESYSAGGEPLYTVSQPTTPFNKGVKCTDYIFYSYMTIRPVRLMSIPVLSHLIGDDPQESLAAINPLYSTPPPIFVDAFNSHSITALSQSKLLSRSTSFRFQSSDDRRTITQLKEKLAPALNKSLQDPKCFWGGAWLPFTAENSKRKHCWLPNDCFVSSHIALYSELILIEDNLPSVLNKK